MNPESHLFPKESVPHDAHTITLNGTEYDVYKLIHYAREIEPVKLNVNDLESQVLEEPCWEDTVGNTFSPKNLLTAYNEYGSWENVEKRHPEWIKHIDKTKNADLGHPILMYQHEMLDGMHRLIRACTEKIGTINVRILNKLPEETLLKK